MKKFIRTPRALLLGVTALAVVLVGAGVASGTIGASKPNVYWACVPKDGRIKLVYPGSKCKPGERFITWHQKGQQSATVVQDGLQGLKGDAGAQGEAGAAGAKGTDGAPGPQGAKGDKGERCRWPKGGRQRRQRCCTVPTGENGAEGRRRRRWSRGPEGRRTVRRARQGRIPARMVRQGATGPKGDTGASWCAGREGRARCRPARRATRVTRGHSAPRRASRPRAQTTTTRPRSRPRRRAPTGRRLWPVATRSMLLSDHAEITVVTASRLSTSPRGRYRVQDEGNKIGCLEASRRTPSACRSRRATRTKRREACGPPVSFKVGVWR